MENVWWRQITNAANFIKEITDKLVDQKSIVLCVPQTVPWKRRFDEIIRENVSRENSKKSFDVFDSPTEKIGEFMLNRYCDDGKRIQYRSGKTHAQFLAESTDIVLNDRFVWVKVTTQSILSEWIEFVADYNKHLPRNVIPAVFILETSCSDPIKARKGIEFVSFDKSISHFDAYTFCMLAISEYKFSDCIKPYFAELVSDICGNDVEFCAACIKYGVEFMEKPIQVIQKLYNVPRSNGQLFSCDYDDAAIQRLVWKAQIKTVFPVIEDFRAYFISKYRNEVQSGLPLDGSNGEKINRPEDVDMGGLYHLFKNGKFVTVSDKEKNRLVKFREARNTLAHCKMLTFDEAAKVLSECEK